MKPRAIILDFDGVVLESNDAKTAAFAELAAPYPVEGPQLMAFHFANQSLPRRYKLQYFAGVLGRPGDAELIGQLEEALSALIVGRVVSCAAVPGALDFLHEFSRQMPLYLSSATPRTELMTILEARQLTPFFTEVFGDPPQPKADAIKAVLAREAVTPPELLSIGDAASDLQVATDAGVPFIGRESGLLNGATCERHADLFGIAQAVRDRCQS